MVLPHLQTAGCDAEVLAVLPECVAAPRDDWLLTQMPATVQVHRCRAMSLSWRRVPGFGTLTYRALSSLRRMGDDLLKQAVASKKAFDLVYFSSTQFGIHVLGPYWKRRFGIPFAMDYQDPWVNDYYSTHPDVVPPGGRFKYAVSYLLAKRTEPRVLRQCAGVTAVSSKYVENLRNRYDFLPADLPVCIAPFPGEPKDLEAVRRDRSIRQNIFDPTDGLEHWVYIGRGGEDMHKALGGFFTSLVHARENSPQAFSRLRIHFVGTSYAASGHGMKTIEPMAAQYGLSDTVMEQTDRIPYAQTLRCILDANALIVLGSDDPSYTASKIYPYLLANKPILAIFNASSSVCELIERCGGAQLVKFSCNESGQDIARKLDSNWFYPAKKGSSSITPTASPFDLEKFAPHLATNQARELTNFFQTVVRQRASSYSGRHR